MKKKRVDLRPTDGELEILRVLWSRGASSVGEVHKVLHAEKGTAYNTTLKLMQIMFEKGLVRRDESVRPQIYSASVPEGASCSGIWCGIFAAGVWGVGAEDGGGALTATDLSAGERAEIRTLLDDVNTKARSHEGPRRKD